MFNRPHHLRVAAILQTLDADLLARHHCYFGGGTAIVLARNEYRESVDIDFIASDKAGYRALRLAMTGRKGLNAISRAGATLKRKGDLRVDQYGIRAMIDAAGAEIKFEIIFEGRISLELSQDKICGVTSLSELDMATAKLLANSDRWADDAVHSRDLIDLAMLNLPRPLLNRAKEKAAGAYGESVERDLARAVERLRERTGRLDECMDALKMDSVPKALLWSRMRALPAKR